MKPNFLIVGAPKCGTTSLYTYLKGHPQIFFPNIKEPHFFGSDLSPTEFQGDESLYMDLFKKSHAKMTGEASTWYLYSKRAAKEIYRFNPEMKIIIMLRNPADAAQSLHSQSLFTMNEVEKDFETALSLEEDRRKGQYIPQNTKRIESLFYTCAFKYSEQIDRYMNVFDIKNLHFITFEDLKINPTQVVKHVLSFLDLETGYTFDIKVKNQQKAPKSLLLQSLLQKKDKKFTRWIPVGVRRKVHSFLKDLNSTKVQKKQMNAVLREDLNTLFEEDINRTEKLLNRPLDEWRI